MHLKHIPKKYHNQNTITSLKKLIILENFFCVNRSYLVDCSKGRFFCNLIFFLVLLTVFVTTFYDFYFYMSEMSISMLSFQIVIGFEVFYLSIRARNEKSLNSLTRLDEKCGVDEEYLKRIKSTVSNTVLFGIVSSILDVAGAMLIVSKPSVVISLCIATAAHDAEMAFYSILYEGMNLRLAIIDKLSIHFGFKVYRHVLITALNLSEEFTARLLRFRDQSQLIDQRVLNTLIMFEDIANANNAAFWIGSPVFVVGYMSVIDKLEENQLRFLQEMTVLTVRLIRSSLFNYIQKNILLMLASTLLTTVVYSVIFILADLDILPRLCFVLIWRELKALHSLWVLCATAANTKTICDDLSFVLASRLALYSKDKESKLHKATKQLLSCVQSQRPRYLSGMILSIDLALPVDLIDLSVNYLLIIVQIYIAFK